MSVDATLEATGADEILFEFRVENTGETVIDVRFTSGQTADVFVYEEGDVPAELGEGDPVWQWSEGQFFTQAIRDVTLDPGGTVGDDLTWRDPEPGEYVAVGTLAADLDAQARTTFSV